jgi:hypothetical protein
MNLPRNSKFLLLAIIAALSKKWHANRDKKLLRSSIKIERIMPHCNTKCQKHKQLLTSWKIQAKENSDFSYSLNTLTCLKQNGMARTPTPIMLFAKVITVPVLVPIVISSCQTYYILQDIISVVNKQSHQTCYSQGYVSNPLET